MVGQPWALDGHGEDFRLLTTLGLTHVETEVYVALLGQGPMPAKAICENVHHAQSSVYLALRALIDKGVVEGGGGYSARYHAVPPRRALQALLDHAAQEMRRRPGVRDRRQRRRTRPHRHRRAVVARRPALHGRDRLGLGRLRQHLEHDRGHRRYRRGHPVPAPTDGSVQLPVRRRARRQLPDRAGLRRARRRLPARPASVRRQRQRPVRPHRPRHRS
ncbi:hypothetical protein E1262_29435 [Jiangella aurantiaca]|uniref:Transcription regulator TrmB N-terminal domain-containing protein n=1 Tax=Jiangella aurantiaca TaxID=2530373 RepID=A0A4R4ZXS3_9ACTN|nr:hypothetical protein E1262_29435 [Jiangella aurantiaca]